jgi:hypothetical protein
MVDRLTAGLRRKCSFGQQMVVEFVIDFGSRAGDLALLEERIARYNKWLNSDFLAATGGDRFAARPAVANQSERPVSTRPRGFIERWAPRSETRELLGTVSKVPELIRAAHPDAFSG